MVGKLHKKILKRNIKLTRKILLDHDKIEGNFKLEDGIWKSDYYEVDRVVIGDGNGNVLLDFIYTFLPNNYK